MHNSSTKLYVSDSQSRFFREAVFVADPSEWLQPGGPVRIAWPGGLDFFCYFFGVQDKLIIRL